MTEQKFIPALGYDFLSEYYDLTIKLTMPEKKFRTKLIDWLNPLSRGKYFGVRASERLKTSYY